MYEDWGAGPDPLLDESKDTIIKAARGRLDDYRRIEVKLLDMLSAWQSVHALLAPSMQTMLNDLNNETLAVLNREAG